MTSDERRNPAVLHNMSCRPNVTIKHRCADGCRPVRITGRASLKRLAESFGLKDTAELAYEQLMAAVRVNDRLQSLPPLVPVRASVGLNRHEALCDDPHFVLAILARSSKTIFMRRKGPIVSRDLLSRNLDLLLPQDWRLES